MKGTLKKQAEEKVGSEVVAQGQGFDAIKAVRKPVLTKANEEAQGAWGGQWRHYTRFDRVVIVVESCFKCDEKSGLFVRKGRTRRLRS